MVTKLYMGIYNIEKVSASVHYLFTSLTSQ